MALTVYLAGPYAAREQIRQCAHDLLDMGYRVRCRWLDGTHEITDGTCGPAEDFPLTERQRFAREDLEDVAAADVLVAFTLGVLDVPDGRGLSGGRHVETGYALAKGKRVVLVGQPENVSHWLPNVVRRDDWHAACVYLARLLVDEYQPKIYQPEVRR